MGAGLPQHREWGGGRERKRTSTRFLKEQAPARPRCRSLRTKPDCVPELSEGGSSVDCKCVFCTWSAETHLSPSCESVKETVSFYLELVSVFGIFFSH